MNGFHLGLSSLLSFNWEIAAEHRSRSLTPLPGFVLNHIPVLYQDSIFDAKNVSCNPVHRLKPENRREQSRSLHRHNRPRLVLNVAEAF